MWQWSLNWDDVTDNIVIGTCPMTPGDLRQIYQQAAISAVLSLQHDDDLAYWGIDREAMLRAGRELGLCMAGCPIRDFDIAHMRRQLPEAIRQLAQLRAKGHRVYVHCTAGLGRAPLTVLGYLIMVEGYHPEDAIRRILRARPGAVPAWEAYHGCRADLVARHKEAIEQRAYELYEQGVHDAPEHDWLQAEAEVLTEVLRGG